MKQIIPFTKEIVFKSNIACITSISLEHEEKVYDHEINGEFIIYGDYKEHNDTTEKLNFKYRLPFTTIIPDNLDENTIKVDIDDFTYDNIEQDVIKVNIDFSIEGEEKEISNEDFDERPKSELLDFEEIDSDLSPFKKENVFSSVECDYIEPERVIDDNIDVDDEASVDDNTIINNEVNIDDININEKTNNKINISDSNIIIDNKEENNENTTQILENNTPNIEVNTNNDYITYHIHIVNDQESIEDIIKKYDTTLDNIKQYNNISNIAIGDKIIIPEYFDE